MIPPCTLFQFRSLSSEPLTAFGVSMPPWPGIGTMYGVGEVEVVAGRWEPTVGSGMAEHGTEREGKGQIGNAN